VDYLFTRENSNYTQLIDMNQVRFNSSLIKKKKRKGRRTGIGLRQTLKKAGLKGTA